MKPTFGQQAAQKSFLHLGHCHDESLKNPPIGFPQEEQNPLTTGRTFS